MASSSSSKPTALHYMLVLFVLASLILGMLYYVEHGAAVTASAATKKASDEKKTLDAEYQKLFTEQETLKKLIVGPSAPTVPEVGSFETPAEGTLMAMVLKDHFGKLALPPGEISYKRLVDIAAQERKTRDDAIATAKSEQAVQETAYAALESKYNALLAAEKTSRSGSESQLQDVTKSKEEVVSTLNSDIEKLRTAYTELDTTSANAKLAFDKEKKTFEDRIRRLTALNEKLNDEIELYKKTSFEVASGEIRYVDTQNKLVYINRGEADRLPKRTTFSVYSKSHSGIGRGAKDIKGSIEVTRIIDAHTAECRITKENIYEPIAQGDPIYTPLWFPGQAQRFSFIGLVDLDGDGQDDRQELHEVLKNAQAIVDSEVLKNGDIQGAAVSAESPTGITEVTKFLVLGAMPELADTTNDEEKNTITKINNHLKAMRDSAREHGVRIITMSDFLSYIGYKSNRRLFKPGSDTRYPTGGTSTQGTMGTRESSGQTSSIYDPKKANLRPPTSGNLNKLFKGR